MKKGLVSCIIPIVRNDPFVEECVAAIKASTYKNIEIIVVDEGLERSAQRNIGFDRAKGKFYMWIDSDMRLHPKLIDDCVRKIVGHTAVYVPERIVTEGWFGRLRDWERQFYNGTLVDVVRFIRAKDCPRFDEALHGVEDSDWERQILKAKPTATFATSDFPFYHHDQVGVKRYLQKKAYYAQSLNQYKSKNPTDRLLTFKYRCFDVFTQNGKWKRFIAKPHYAAGVMALIFARGLIYVHRRLFYR